MEPWELEVVINGTCNQMLEDPSLERVLTEESSEEEGWEGRVATPPVVSAEVTRESCKYRIENTSWERLPSLPCPRV